MSLVEIPFAPLVQLAEHRSYEPKVMGSSPIWSIWGARKGSTEREHGIARIAQLVRAHDC